MTSSLGFQTHGDDLRFEEGKGYLGIRGRRMLLAGRGSGYFYVLKS